MAHVIYQGRDLGDVTDEAELAYYRRETDTTIDGVSTTADAAAPSTRLTKPELQRQARDLGLDDSGTKAEIEARIAEHEKLGAVIEDVEPVDEEPAVESVEVAE